MSERCIEYGVSLGVLIPLISDHPHSLNRHYNYAHFKLTMSKWLARYQMHYIFFGNFIVFLNSWFSAIWKYLTCSMTITIAHVLLNKKCGMLNCNQLTECLHVFCALAAFPVRPATMWTQSTRSVSPVRLTTSYVTAIHGVSSHVWNVAVVWLHATDRSVCLPVITNRREVTESMTSHHFPGIVVERYAVAAFHSLLVFNYKLAFL